MAFALFGTTLNQWTRRTARTFAAAEQIIGQAGPDLGNMRGGLVANATSGTVALVSGGLLCLAAVTVIATTTPGLRRFTTPSPPHEAAPTS